MTRLVIIKSVLSSHVLYQHFAMFLKPLLALLHHAVFVSNFSSAGSHSHYQSLESQVLSTLIELSALKAMAEDDKGAEALAQDNEVVRTLIGILKAQRSLLLRGRAAVLLATLEEPPVVASIMEVRAGGTNSLALFSRP